MKLIIVRHGETDRNKFGLYTGKVDVSLNATGLNQAAKVARRLARERIEGIYSSDFRRARETADIIAKLHPHTPFVLDPQVRERNSGRFSGTSLAHREKAFKASGKSYRTWKPEGGESVNDMKKRANRWLKKCLKNHQKQTVLVVTHGLFIHTLLECALEQGGEAEKGKYDHWNTGVTTLEIPSHGIAKVIHLNNSAHLKKVQRNVHNFGEKYGGRPLKT